MKEKKNISVVMEGNRETIIIPVVREKIGPRKQEKKKIIILVERGLIQDIIGIPSGMIIEIRDYDIEGGPDEDCIRKDEDGDEYMPSTWGA